MSTPDYKTMIDNMAGEFRADALARLESITRLLDEFQVNEDRLSDDFELILEEIHSIKGTAKTFGYGALSHVAHAMNDWMFEIKNNGGTTIALSAPALGDDLRVFVSIMVDVTQGEGRQSEQQGRDAISRADFSLYSA